jgi:hypothetical protein
MFSNYTNIDEMLHSGRIEHCECRENKPNCDSSNWAERNATALEHGI